MKWVDNIDVYLIAHTMPTRQMDAWVESHGIAAESSLRDLIAYIGKRCYNSFRVGENLNLTQVRQDLADTFENFLKQGHGSVLEHVSFTFAIENCTRVFTAEMNRHRVGTAISEGSMRYIRTDELKVWLSPYLKSLPWEIFEAIEANFNELEHNYKFVLNKFNWDKMDFTEKKIATSALRRMLPMGICTGGVWTMNLRALRHIVTMRVSPHAEEEINIIVKEMFRQIYTKFQDLFPDWDENNSSLKFGRV